MKEIYRILRKSEHDPNGLESYKILMITIQEFLAMRLGKVQETHRTRDNIKILRTDFNRWTHTTQQIRDTYRFLVTETTQDSQRAQETNKNLGIHRIHECEISSRNTERITIYATGRADRPKTPSHHNTYVRWNNWIKTLEPTKENEANGET